jgi:hypothetical protein
MLLLRLALLLLLTPPVLLLLLLAASAAGCHCAHHPLRPPMPSIERKPAASGAPRSADSKTPDVNQKNGRVILHSQKQACGDSNAADLRFGISLAFMYGGRLHGDHHWRFLP